MNKKEIYDLGSKVCLINNIQIAYYIEYKEVSNLPDMLICDKLILGFARAPKTFYPKILIAAKSFSKSMKKRFSDKTCSDKGAQVYSRGTKAISSLKEYMETFDVYNKKDFEAMCLMGYNSINL